MQPTRRDSWRGLRPTAAPKVLRQGARHNEAVALDLLLEQRVVQKTRRGVEPATKAIRLKMGV